MEIVDKATGFLSCYGCAKCTSGCPTAHRMDLKPHQIMRLLQLGRTDELLSAAAPWRCVACQTCRARCPNAIDIPAVMDGIRAAARRIGSPAGAGGIPRFDELFLDMIRRRGRVNDGLLAFRYRLRSGRLLDDWRIGLKMFMAGKLKVRTPGVAHVQDVARLFEPEDAKREAAP
jgi:heterodisulfide reductase subunit C